MIIFHNLFYHSSKRGFTLLTILFSLSLGLIRGNGHHAETRSVIIVGETGVGKSSIADYLIGENPLSSHRNFEYCACCFPSGDEHIYCHMLGDDFPANCNNNKYQSDTIRHQICRDPTFAIGDYISRYGQTKKIKINERDNTNNFPKVFLSHDKYDYKTDNGEPRFVNPDFRDRFTIKVADTPGFFGLDRDEYIVHQLVDQMKQFYKTNVTPSEPLSAFIHVNNPGATRRMPFLRMDSFINILIEMTRVFGINYLKNIIFVYNKTYKIDYFVEQGKSSIHSKIDALKSTPTEEQYRNIITNHMEQFLYDEYKNVNSLITTHDDFESLRSGMDDDTWEEFNSMITQDYFASRSVVLDSWADYNEWNGAVLRDTQEDIKNAMNKRGLYNEESSSRVFLKILEDPAKTRVLRDYYQSKFIYLVNKLHQNPLSAPLMNTTTSFECAEVEQKCSGQGTKFYTDQNYQCDCIDIKCRCDNGIPSNNNKRCGNLGENDKYQSCKSCDENYELDYELHEGFVFDVTCVKIDGRRSFLGY